MAEGSLSECVCRDRKVFRGGDHRNLVGDRSFDSVALNRQKLIEKLQHESCSSNRQQSNRYYLILGCLVDCLVGGCLQVDRRLNAKVQSGLYYEVFKNEKSNLFCEQEIFKNILKYYNKCVIINFVKIFVKDYQ